MFEELFRPLVELWGRYQDPVEITFGEDQIISSQENFYVNWITGARFFSLDPGIYAVIVSPEGESQQIKGGYLKLRRGKYKLFYVDKRNRTYNLGKITETTIEGTTITLGLTITYRVADPSRLLELQEPLPTLFSLIETDVREYIKNHNHDEIMGGGENQITDSGPIVQYIQHKQLNHPQTSRVFVITSVAIEREGDPTLINLRMQQKQNLAEHKLAYDKKELEQKLLEQEEKVLEKDAEIRRLVAEKEVEVNKLKAESEAAIETIRAEAEATKQETLRRMKIFQNKHEIDMEAIKALIPALTIPGRTLTQSETQAIQALINTLKDEDNLSSLPSAATPPAQAAEKPPADSSANTLASTLLDLLRSPQTRKN